MRASVIVTPSISISAQQSTHKSVKHKSTHFYHKHSCISVSCNNFLQLRLVDCCVQRLTLHTFFTHNKNNSSHAAWMQPQPWRCRWGQRCAFFFQLTSPPSSVSRCRTQEGESTMARGSQTRRAHTQDDLLCVKLAMIEFYSAFALL